MKTVEEMEKIFAPIRDQCVEIYNMTIEDPSLENMFMYKTICEIHAYEICLNYKMGGVPSYLGYELGLDCIADAGDTKCPKIRHELDKIWLEILVESLMEFGLNSIVDYIHDAVGEI
ncbi:hypothetical protein [Anaerovibrio sp. RM50]|uniref:hypothetical protein n=1 Tax=Anaerovibrio sp. RM50 TaxID=1200557 RepID=UPI00047F4D69|nr:hypothetical protein [Anaerovibrio sp. RM50]